MKKPVAKVWDETLAALELDRSTALNTANQRMQPGARFAELFTLDDLRTMARAAELVTTLMALQMSDRQMDALERTRSTVMELRGIVIGYAAAKDIIPASLLGR